MISSSHESMSRCPVVMSCCELELSEVSEIVFIIFKYNTHIMISTPENANMKIFCFGLQIIMSQNMTAKSVYTVYLVYPFTFIVSHNMTAKSVSVYTVYLVYLFIFHTDAPCHHAYICLPCLPLYSSYYSSPQHCLHPCLTVYPVY